ncbi:flagellar assembly peptidoglycan hydrolase FlgJ [Haliea sp.]
MALTVNSGFAGDAAGFGGLKLAAQREDPAAVREAAQQFEALLVQTMLKEMRAATADDGLFGSSQMDTYYEMFDQQIALEMTRKGGMGLADMLVRQLGGDEQAAGGNTLPAGGLPAAGMPVPPRPPTSALPAPAARAAAAAGPAEPAAAMAAARTPAFASADDFVGSLLPLAREAADHLGVPAEAILAQSALETGWGQHLLPHPAGGPAWNLFGIKAGRDWTGPVASAVTLEVRDGVAVRETARFRAYGSPAEAMADYTRFLSGRSRYAEVPGAGDSASFARALQQAGYATDPEYAAKIGRVEATVRQLLPAQENASLAATGPDGRTGSAG